MKLSEMLEAYRNGERDLPTYAELSEIADRKSRWKRVVENVLEHPDNRIRSVHRIAIQAMVDD